jgi:hypothetical protein
MPSPTPPGPEKSPELEGMPASVRQALAEVAPLSRHSTGTRRN